ncbi:urease accessory protein [Niveomyces insectorum RCEF 264]|uniref:Urease accessory protein n=1 Tax=Niveomyces insectorum RCEF 264 TaxID=1081102 RepID=A0A162MNS8_9HYPO|nr:urease accessory protein [Niveomyces insectorum RCEF 264]
MNSSPFPPSTAAPGDGRLVVGLVPHGESGIEAMSYQYPLKLIAPSTGSGGGGTSVNDNKNNNDDDDDATGGHAVAPHKKSALVFLLSYGGGLVAGDQVHLTVHVRAGARLTLVTQGTTKVFKAPSAAAATGGRAFVDITTRQTLEMRVAAGAGLCLLPDPVQPFADSVYEQLQVARLARPTTEAADPSLCLLDWVTQGRAARGENWSFTRWLGRNEVWLTGDDGNDNDGEAAAAADRLLVRDAVLLAPAYLEDDDGGSNTFSSPPPSASSTALRDAMHGLAVVGTLILRGPLVAALGRFFLDEFAALPRLGARDFRDVDPSGAPRKPPPKPEQLVFPLSSSSFSSSSSLSLEAWRAGRLQLEQSQGVLWSAAAVRGCVVVKFGARSVEGGRHWIGAMLLREGSVAAAFGEEALMCVR